MGVQMFLTVLHGLQLMQTVSIFHGLKTLVLHTIAAAIATVLGVIGGPGVIAAMGTAALGAISRWSIRRNC